MGVIVGWFVASSKSRVCLFEATCVHQHEHWCRALATGVACFIALPVACGCGDMKQSSDLFLLI